MFESRSMPSILVVDDEPSVRVTLAANLELAGFEVCEAGSVAEAIHHLRSSRFDLLISDIRMPGMDGLAGLGALREIQSDLPAVFVTGYDAEGALETAIAKGAYTVLPKPIAVDKLVSVVRSCLAGPVVLVVDDDTPFLETIVEGLTLAGLQVERAQSGDEALEILARSKVDVCVLDLVLPERDGVEIYAQLKARSPELSVIAMTGHDVAELVREVMKGGADHCLRKPFELHVLARLIGRARAERSHGPGEIDP